MITYEGVTGTTSQDLALLTRGTLDSARYPIYASAKSFQTVRNADRVCEIVRSEEKMPSQRAKVSTDERAGIVKQWDQEWKDSLDSYKTLFLAAS